MTGENYVTQSLNHNSFWSQNVIRMMKSWRSEWASYVACAGKTRNAYKITNGKLEGKKPMGRNGHGWEGKIRMDLNKMK